MGFHERPGTWKTRAENKIGADQEKGMNLSDFVERLRRQAEMYIEENPGPAMAFKSQYLDFILDAKNPLKAGEKVARENPHFQLDTLDDSGQQGAFLVALAQKLDEPQYNQ